jgi:ATP-dependent Clp protease ATP-binding subunit ClpA
VDDVRRIATATLPPAAATVPDLVPFDPHARAALERAFAEAQRLGAEVVDAGHVLLAVLAVEDGTGVLAAFGVDPATVEADLALGG